ncbi:enhancer of polycomb homolog 1-like [Babylonia areolata]|uniref:enhancer of polycomb homolog 1-like n=1 Tax=Babylonia areolata TaxID=304850 RepID=UPI003FD2F65D
MSKVSFRARALDVYKPMPVYRYEEIPDLRDFDKINRAVVQMPTGMEKEEETETHLQKALTAQQFYGTAEVRAIPIPDVRCVDERYEKLYLADYKTTKQYIHIQALGMEQEIPDYDLDSEDESWLQEQSKKMEISNIKFEEMMDRLEKGSGQQVVTLPEAKLLLKEDDDLIISVYDYWLNKRLRLEMPLISQVKSEKRDGTTTNNPYVAFRRRTEKMQTRKNRKNDEVSYERMLKLKRDMVKASTLTEFLKRREKSKKEILQLTLEILEKRYQMADYSGNMLAEAEAERAKMPLFVPPYMFNSHGLTVPTMNGEEVAPVRKKRQYRRRQKQGQQPVHPHAAAAAMATSATFSGEVDILRHALDSSEDDFLSPTLSPSEHEDENDPDGPFAFKRRKTCNYYAPLLSRHGNWPWCDPKEGGKGDKRHRFSLTTLPGGRCVGYARRRVGRGGRVILDRGYTPWDDGLDRLDLVSGQSYRGQLGDYITYIREKNIPYYKPQSPPPPEEDWEDITHSSLLSKSSSSSLLSKSSSSSTSSMAVKSDFNVESFHCHRQQLLAMHRKQEWRQSHHHCPSPSPSSSGVNGHSHSQQQSASGSVNGHGQQQSASGSVNGQRHRQSFCSQPTSRFTLDSASAQFAVTAVIDSAHLDPKGGKEEGGEGSGEGAGQPGKVKVVSDHCGALSSSSSSTSSAPSSSCELPVSFSSHPPLAAVKTVAVSSACGVQSQNSVMTSSSSSSLSVTSLLSLSSQSCRAVQLQPGSCVVRPNGPLVTSAVPSGWVPGKNSASILQLPVPMTTAAVLRAVVPASPSPSSSSSSSCSSLPTSTPVAVCAASAIMAGKTLTGSKMVAAGVTGSGMCNRPSSSAISILKTSHEEGGSSVHIFTKDTPVPMDVS